MKQSHLHQISPNGRYLAIVTPDGCLKIWESATRIQKLEYTPPSNLISPISALAWIPLTATKKSNQLAFGTASGRVMVFNLKDGEMQTLPQEHQTAVTGLAWDSNGNSLYSASEDKQVLCWSLDRQKVEARWNGGVCGLAVVPDPPRLVAAQPHSFILWSLPDHTAICSLDGHTRPVLQAAAVSSSLVVSAAQDDHALCCWDLNREATLPAACLKLSGEPVGFSQQLLTFDDGEYLQLAVWTAKGSMHVFHCKSHFKNKKKNKPILPKTEVTLLHKQFNEKSSEILPILAAHIYPDGSILVAYGPYLNPVFEKLTPDLEQKSCFLIRKIELPQLNAGQVQKGVRANIAIGSASKVHSAAYKKDQPLLSGTASASPTPHDFEAHRLILSLQNNDLEVLREIFELEDNDLIKSIVDRLSVEHIVPFLEYLTQNWVYNKKCNSWLKALYYQFGEEIMSMSDPYLIELLEDMSEILGNAPRPLYPIETLEGILQSDENVAPDHTFTPNPDVKAQRQSFKDLGKASLECLVISAEDGRPKKKIRNK